MEPGNLAAAAGPGTHDLTSESEIIDVATRMLSGLDIRGNDHVEPLALVHQASQSNLPQILESLREMKAVHANPQKQWFQIPLKAIFIHALKSVGIAEPLFSVLNRQGCFQVTIQFTSNLPIHILGASRHASIVGDFAHTYELAEGYAIDKGFVHLRQVHDLQLVDISARKEKSLIRTSRKLYCNVMSVHRLIGTMLAKWHNCLDNLGQVQRFAFPKLKNVHPDESRFADSVYNSLNHINLISVEKIREFDGMMKLLSHEKDKYVEASRAKSDLTYRVCDKKAYFEDVNALDLLTKFLKLGDCHYSVILGDDGLYIATVMLPIAADQSTVLPEGTWIQAKEVRRTIGKAKNAAARAAISQLELHFNVELSGYNHIAKVEAEQEMYVWKGLNNQICMLAANLFNSWEGMLQRLEESVVLHKNICSMLASRAEVGNEMVFIYDLVGRFDLAASRGRETFKVAAAKLNSLIEEYTAYLVPQLPNIATK